MVVFPGPDRQRNSKLAVKRLAGPLPAFRQVLAPSAHREYFGISSSRSSSPCIRPSIIPRVNTDLKGLQHAVCFLVLFIPEPPECPFRMALAVYGLPGRGAPGGPQSASSPVAPNPCFG